MKIENRVLEKADDGTYFATNAVTLLYQDADGKDITFYCDPNGLYMMILRGIRKIAQLEHDSEHSANETEEMSSLRKQLAKVMRAGVKGILMMWGDKLLTVFWGTSEHPHPPKDKKLDLVDWYMEQFTTVMIVNMMKQDVILTGQFVRNNVITVDEIYTRPIAAPTSSDGDTRDNIPAE